MNFADDPERILEKSQRKMAIIFISSMLTMATMIFWYLIFESPPLIYDDLPFEIIGGPFTPGSIVSYTVHKCNKTNQVIAYTVTQGLESIDGNYILDLGQTKIITEPGCGNSISRITVLPKNLAPGKYKVVGVSEVPGTVKVHFVKWSTNSFIVVD